MFALVIVSNSTQPQSVVVEGLRGHTRFSPVLPPGKDGAGPTVFGQIQVPTQP